MLDRILNTDYYRSLVQTFAANVEFNSSLLPISNFCKINLSFIQKAINKASGFDTIIKIPKCYDGLLQRIYSNLYLFVANAQFYENYTNPTLIKNQKVVEKKGKRIYKIKHVRDGFYDLEEDIKADSIRHRYPAILPKRTYENILNNFRIIRKKMKKNTMDSFITLFSSLNSLDQNSDLIPTEFSKVSIFIGPKYLWESFKDFSLEQSNLWKSIPSQYISREGDKIDSIGISPLLYFTSSYRIAYQEILQKQIEVNNIILFNDGFDELQQMISDQFQYGFRILGICTSAIENRTDTIKYWQWHKEEINLLESL